MGRKLVYRSQPPMTKHEAEQTTDATTRSEDDYYFTWVFFFGKVYFCTSYRFAPSLVQPSHKNKWWWNTSDPICFKIFVLRLNNPSFYICGSSFILTVSFSHMYFSASQNVMLQNMNFCQKLQLNIHILRIKKHKIFQYYSLISPSSSSSSTPLIYRTLLHLAIKR